MLGFISCNAQHTRVPAEVVTASACQHPQVLRAHPQWSHFRRLRLNGWSRLRHSHGLPVACLQHRHTVRTNGKDLLKIKILRRSLREQPRCACRHVVAGHWQAWQTVLSGPVLRDKHVSNRRRVS